MSKFFWILLNMKLFYVICNSPISRIRLGVLIFLFLQERDMLKDELCFD